MQLWSFLRAHYTEIADKYKVRLPAFLLFEDGGEEDEERSNAMRFSKLDR